MYLSHAFPLLFASTLSSLMLVGPRNASAEECTEADILELVSGCSVLVDNEDLELRLHAPPKAEISTPQGVREALNRAIIYLHGYGTRHTWPPQVLYEHGGSGEFLDFHNAGISIVGIAPGNAPSDGVEDDAIAVRRALEMLNAWRGEEAIPWVVFGHSMGGLMARIALAQMERDGADHQVSLYVSYDSPHTGVHVPQGMQYLKIKLEEWTEMTEEDFIAIDPGWKGVFRLGSIDGMKDTLSSGAVSGFPDPTSLQAQQMTIQGLVLPDAYPAFMNFLNETGFPKVRSIAVTNGNTLGIGTSQEILPGERLFYFSGAKGNSAASVRGTFEVFTDKPGDYCFKSHVYYDGTFRNHDGGRKDARTAEGIVALDHRSGGSLDYAEQMELAAYRARRDFHNPKYSGAKNSPIPFVLTSSALGLPWETEDSDIASIVASGGTPFNEVIAIGNLTGFADNIDHNTIVLSEALLDEIHALLPCREGIDVLGCVDDDAEDGADEDHGQNGWCGEFQHLDSEGNCHKADGRFRNEDGIECTCTSASPISTALWLAILGLAWIRQRHQFSQKRLFGEVPIANCSAGGGRTSRAEL